MINNRFINRVETGDIEIVAEEEPSSELDIQAISEKFNIKEKVINSFIDFLNDLKKIGWCNVSQMPSYSKFKEDLDTMVGNTYEIINTPHIDRSKKIKEEEKEKKIEVIWNEPLPYNMSFSQEDFEKIKSSLNKETEEKIIEDVLKPFVEKHIQLQKDPTKTSEEISKKYLMRGFMLGRRALLKLRKLKFLMFLMSL